MGRVAGRGWLQGLATSWVTVVAKARRGWGPGAGLPVCAHPQADPLCVRRKRNDDEDALEEFYTLVTHVPVLPGGYKGLETKLAEED